jgi:predicted amidophosphoribosyltransferase
MALSLSQSVRSFKAGTIRALDTVFPHQCLACDTRVEARGLCGACRGEAVFLQGLVCDACGAPLPGEGDGGREMCDDCLCWPRPWGQGRAAMAYSGTGRRLVLALKHGDRQDIVGPASAWMATAAGALELSDAVLCPIPLHPWRRLKRRDNQAALLARGVAAVLGQEYRPDLLIRTRRTRPTDGMTRDERFEELRGSHAVRPGRDDALSGRHVLLIDDVMTSGATLAAATEAVLRSGAARVSVLVLARVIKDT